MSDSKRIVCALCQRPRLKGGPKVKSALPGTYQVFEHGGLVPYELKGGETICRHHEVDQQNDDS